MNNAARIAVRINTANGSDAATDVTYAEALALIQLKLDKGEVGGLFAIVEDVLFALENVKRPDRTPLLVGATPLWLPTTGLIQSLVDRVELINSHIWYANH